MKATDDDGGLYDLMSGSYQLMGSLDGVYDAILANPDVVLRALGAIPSSPNNGAEWENYWFVPKEAI